MGLTPPAQGRVLWKGGVITGWRTDRIARAGIGFVPEDRRVFAELTVHENLDVARRAAGRAGRWTVDTVCSLFPKLAELRDRRAGFLSGGEQQMLTIGRTLMCNPELLLLDEPSEGLAPLVVASLLEQVAAAQGRGPDDPAGRAGRRVLARARRPRVRAREGRRRPRRSGGGAARRCGPARPVAHALDRTTHIHRGENHAIRDHQDPRRGIRRNAKTRSRAA